MTTVDTSGLNDLVKSIYPQLVEALNAAAANGVVLMKMRIQEGKGLDGQAMKPYSKEYAKRRQAKGRQTAKRDLSMTGQMVGGIHSTDATVEGTTIKASVAIAGARNRELALYHQKREPFFGYSPADEATIVASLEKKIQELLRTR